MKKIVEIEMSDKKDIHDKLQILLFAGHVNRDSLSRKISQKEIFTIDYLAHSVIANIYSLLRLSFDSSEEEKIKIVEDNIKNSMESVMELKKLILESLKENKNE